MKYWLHPEAAAEHRKQIAYYEERQAGLGRRYHADYRAALALACEAPQRHPVVFPPAIRRVGFQVFRFDLLYREVAGVIQVMAVAGHRRQPNYWLARL